MLRHNNNKSTSAHKILFSHISRMLRVSLKQKSEPSKIAFKNCKRKFWEQKAAIYVSSTFLLWVYSPHHPSLRKPLWLLHPRLPQSEALPDLRTNHPGHFRSVVGNLYKSRSGRCWISTSMQFCFHSSLYNKTNQGDLTLPKRKGSS